jgi:succinoglycan biosynthesis protein ExoO
MSSLDKPLVSVIIPAYKASDTLEKAVFSALSQLENTPEAIEVVIVDDCSPDNTFDFAQELARKDTRIRVFRLEKNAGAAYARNYAIKQARGTWLAVLDADDWYEPKRFENMLKDATAANVEMVADNQYFFDKKADKIVGTAFPQNGRKRIVDLDIFLKYSNATKHFDYGMLKPIFRADFLQKHGVEYYAPDRTGHDYFVLFCFFAAGGKGILTDVPYYNYVQPFGSISREGQQEGRKHYDAVLQKNITQHFIELYQGKISESQMKELLRRKREAEALIYFYDLREALYKKNIKSVFDVLLKTNFEFWKMIVGRIFKRIYVRIFGLPPYIFSDLR